MKAKITFLLCGVISFFALQTDAQVNYVLNPSFEQHWQCPDAADEIKFANYWSAEDSTNHPPADPYGAIGCTPEYCNICGTGLGAVPYNGEFHHYPRTGAGMAEVQMFTDSSAIPYLRDYLQGRLYKPLSNGKSYCVSFYVCLASGSGAAVNKIGAYVDNGRIDTSVNTCGLPKTQFTPQVVDTAIINDTLNWTKIEGSFTADGTEKFITIGNFFDNAHTAVVKSISTSVIPTAWYLVDDVSVIESDHVAFAGNDTTVSVGDSVFLGEIAVPYVWYDGQGNIIDSTSGGIWVHPDSGSNMYVVKQTLCGVVTWDTVVVNAWPLSTSALPSPYMERVTVWPNPVRESLTLSLSEGEGNARVSDAVGRLIIDKHIIKGNTTIDMTCFRNGVYFLQVVYEDGSKDVRKVVKE